MDCRRTREACWEGNCVRSNIAIQTVDRTCFTFVQVKVEPDLTATYSIDVAEVGVDTHAGSVGQGHAFVACQTLSRPVTCITLPTGNTFAIKVVVVCWAGIAAVIRKSCCLKACTLVVESVLEEDVA